MADPGVPTTAEYAAWVEAIARRLLRHVVPLQVLDAKNLTPAGILAGGTGGLVKTERRRFVLTAAHVAEALKREGVLGLLSGGGGSNPVDISSWSVIASDDDLDLATIAVPESFDPAPLQKMFYAPTAWAPPRANREDVAFFVGFPGLHREIFTASVLNHAAPFCDFVSSSSDRHFVLADQEGERVVLEYKKQLAQFGPTGGVSGSPVFISTGGELVLAGVLKEGGEGHDTVFFAAHAGYVRPDGEIAR